MAKVLRLNRSVPPYVSMSCTSTRDTAGDAVLCPNTSKTRRLSQWGIIVSQKHTQSQRSIKCTFVVVSTYGKFLKKINPLLIIFNIIYCQGLKMHTVLIVLQVQKEPLVSASCWLISGSTPVKMISESP